MGSLVLKSIVLKWVRKIGPKEAIRRLTDSDGPNLSISMAEKLVGGRYNAELSFDKGQAILKELAKDGFKMRAPEVA